MSQQIGNPISGIHHGEVKYLCATSASGKSASVLPAFLVNEKATHYLHLAFRNNNGRYFSVATDYVTTNCEKIAERQGAAFMVACVKQLLDHPEKAPFDDVTTVDIVKPQDLKSFEWYTHDLAEYLTAKLGNDY